MNILITGASGFIGKNLLESFSKKYHILTPSHQQLNLLDENIVFQYFQRHPVDIVIHCAIIGGSKIEVNKKEMFYENMRIFMNVIKCNKYFDRLINIGSGASYDKRSPIIKVKETDLGKKIPNDAYGFYKYVCSEYIQKIENVVDLRVFGLFGEWEDYRTRFISNAICRQLFGKNIQINKNVAFDYIDVKDFVKIIDYFIKHKPKKKAYNIGTGNTYTLIDLAKIIQTLNTGRQRIIILKQKGLNNEYTCDASLLREEIPKFQFTPMDDSIQRLYKWYTKQKKYINSNSV